MKVDETRFEIGDIITGTSVSGTVYSITKEEIGEIFFVDPSLFKKKETRFTNFRR